MVKKKLSRLATTAFERNSKMLGSAILSAGRYAAGSLSDKVKLTTFGNNGLLLREIKTLVTQMSELKGTAQKLGQFLSVIGEAHLPEEALIILRTLQQDTPPVSWEVVSKSLRSELSETVLRELDISPEPLATASIGQVHKAVIRSSGDVIALKIQYPDIDQTIASDIKTLKTILKSLALFPKIPDLDGVFDEAKDMLEREVDYTQERTAMDFFRTTLKDDPRFVVPETYSRYSSRRVLATHYEPGLDLSSLEVASLAESIRSDLAEGFLGLYFREFFDLGLVQTDAHFGNYRIRVEGDSAKFILYDFGAMRLFDRKFRSHYTGMVRACLDADRELFDQSWRDLGLVSATSEYSEHLWIASQMIIQPFLLPEQSSYGDDFEPDGRFHWGRSRFARDVSQYVYDHKFNFNIRGVPKELLFLDRKLAGVATILAKLNAPINSRRVLLGVIGH